MGMQTLAKSVQYVKGVGPRRQLSLQKLDIFTLFDLLWNVPRQYEDFGGAVHPEEMQPGEMAVCLGEILRIVKNYTPRMVIVKATLLCGEGMITAVWFNQAYVATVLKEHDTVLIKGKVKRAGYNGEIHVVQFEKRDSIPEEIMPVYALSEGINQKNMRQVMQNVLEESLSAYPEILPDAVRDRFRLLRIEEAWRNIHFPENEEKKTQAHRRLALEEYLLFRMVMKKDGQTEKAVQNFPPLPDEEDEISRTVRRKLPFALTGAQERVIREIRQDMQKPYAMNRLVEGDVGSGKTLVAAFSMLAALSRGMQAAFMAPTEILAMQHFHSLQALLKDTPIVIACLTSSTPRRERETLLEALKDGSLHILVGTHALIQEDLDFCRLGLVVIDEQHRFGVRQRAQLGEKGQNPDVLVMTATPIPRTLALSLYGQLSISVIDELPPGRLAIKTKYLPRRDRMQAYQFACRRIFEGEQAYVICPLVEESEKQNLLDVYTLYEELNAQFGKKIRIGMVHGRMNSEEKQQGLTAFSNGEIQMLIATTVVEVGVDVPQATVMVVEHAERFGLSQLHQLRGRVGRSNRQSYCILLGEPASDTAYKRLLAMQNTNDGFALANLDLKLRGPGDFWGFRQHGLNDLKILDLAGDQAVVELGETVLPLVESVLDSRIQEEYLQMKFPHLKDIAAN